MQNSTKSDPKLQLVQLIWSKNSSSRTALNEVQSLQLSSFLRCLRHFDVDKNLMLLCFNYLCWFSNLTVQNKGRLSRIVTIAEKIISTSLDHLNVLFGKQTIKKVKKILRDDSHVLQPCYKHLPSGKRLRLMPARTNRTKNSFVNTSIRLLTNRFFSAERV